MACEILAGAPARGRPADARRRLYSHRAWPAAPPLGMDGPPAARGDAVSQPSDLLEQFEEFYRGSRDSEALDAKTKALIGIAVVLTGNCQP
jgi:alkylhydroperoxidase/carboxymuconolactone decarboxylase family protein YurZ